MHEIRGRLQIAGGPNIVERLFGQRLSQPGPLFKSGPLLEPEPLFNVAIHQSNQEIILEFEPGEAQTRATPGNIRTIVARLERHREQANLCREAARQVRGMTGFDRVMIYRFDEDGAGEVVSESMRSGMQPFLGLHYPASDIPAQARALYERNILRIIVDVDAEPVPVSPALSPEGTPLDLSMSTLRSVSPIHLEYLRNMGVRSSMSISVLRGDRLWGLIACHHNTPLRIGFQTRSMAELFGQMFSFLLELRQRQQDEETRRPSARTASRDRRRVSPRRTRP